MTEDEVYKKLKTAILQHKIPPNTQLVEDVLAETFHVSRTPIRAALRRLAYDKLVTIIQHKGTFVACPTVEEAKEVFQMRRVIERAAIQQACMYVTTLDIESIRETIQAEHEAHQRHDVSAMLDHSKTIHLKIAEAAHNSYFVRYLDELVSLTYVIIALYGDGTPSEHTDHIAILNALEQHDGESAVKLMMDHLDHIQGHLNFSKFVAGPAQLQNLFN